MNMDKINIEQVINKWFEMKYQTYDKLEHDGSIYLYYDGEEYADIRIDKNSKYIYYRWKLYDEFSKIIDLHYLEFRDFMVKWVENTFGLKGFTQHYKSGYTGKWLKIPK